MGHRGFAAAAAAVAALALGASPSLAARLPVVYNGLAGYSHVSSTASPPGANNWSCKPSAAHPRPVILVHGTFARHVRQLAGALTAARTTTATACSRCNYGSYAGTGLLGIYATGEIASSAHQLSSFVERSKQPRARRRSTSSVIHRAG